MSPLATLSLQTQKEDTGNRAGIFYSDVFLADILAVLRYIIQWL